MKDVFIDTSRTAAFNEAMSIVADTEKGQPGLVMGWGLAGRGKTMAAQRYVTHNRGAVYIRVYQDWTPRAMLAAICSRLNGMNPVRVDKAKQAIIEELDAKQGTVLLIDEADRLAMNNIEHLRDIHDETGVPIALIGEPSLYAKLTARRRILERVTRRVEFGPIQDVDVVMFGAKACGLTIQPDAAVSMVSRSTGSFRLLFHLMVDAERMAQANKTDTITMEMIDSIPNRRMTPSPEKEM